MHNVQLYKLLTRVWAHVRAMDGPMGIGSGLHLNCDLIIKIAEYMCTLVVIHMLRSGRVGNLSERKHI